jgi:hypothetical protein
VFDLCGNERLTEWKKIRDSLQGSDNPYLDVLNIWKKAPLVNQYLNPNDPKSWPDPWHLVLDNRYDELALALGIVYTLGLSERFMSAKIEIHMSIEDLNENNFFVIDNNSTIDVGHRSLRSGDFVLPMVKRIWTYQSKL